MSLMSPSIHSEEVYRSRFAAASDEYWRNFSTQVCELLNKGNQLSKKIDRITPQQYLLHIDGSILNGGAAVAAHAALFAASDARDTPPVAITGCCKLVTLAWHEAELMHISVATGYRRRGVARLLVKAAIAICEQPMLTATVRADNDASLALLISCGFGVSGTFISPRTGNKVFHLIRFMESKYVEVHE